MKTTQNITAKGTLGEMPMQSSAEYRRNTIRAKAAPAQAQHSIEPVTIDAKIRRLENVTRQAFELKHERDEARAHAQRLADALKAVTADIRNRTGSSNPITYGTLRKITEALAEWSKQ